MTKAWRALPAIWAMVGNGAFATAMPDLARLLLARCRTNALQIIVQAVREKKHVGTVQNDIRACFRPFDLQVQTASGSTVASGGNAAGSGFPDDAAAQIEEIETSEIFGHPVRRR